MNLTSSILLISIGLSLACAAQVPRTREEAAKMIEEHERTRDDEAKLRALRQKWNEDPRRTLRKMANADDLIFRPPADQLLLEMKPVFAEHAMELAKEESFFLPLARYANLGFDGKNAVFARTVIKKAILAVPKRFTDGFDFMMLRLLADYGSVAEAQDIQFFRELTLDPTYSEKVREKATAVIAEIGQRSSGPISRSVDGSVTERQPNAKVEAPIDPKEEARSIRTWLVVGALCIGGGVILILLINRRS